MRLTYTCTACKKQNYLKIREQTRPALQMRLNSDEVRVNCDHCGKMDKKHINRITAVADNRILLAGFIGGVLISAIMVFIFGWLAAAILSIPIFVWRYENDSAHKFNSFTIKRK
ncbi:hypothetical protein ABV409_03915 [Flagellimonas sp. DF-77]|uniref:hypothetical protein n=1 Tax=Flagellimonas algarum TaxID=3230298 RepID=UPI00339273CC